MIRKFNSKDTTKVMTIWTKGNFKAHSFIDRDYWIGNYNKVKNEYKEKHSKPFLIVLDDIDSRYEDQDYLQEYPYIRKDAVEAFEKMKKRLLKKEIVFER